MCSHGLIWALRRKMVGLKFVWKHARRPAPESLPSLPFQMHNLSHSVFLLYFNNLKLLLLPLPAPDEGELGHPRQPNPLRPNGANRWGSRYVIPLFIVLYHQIIFDISPILLIIISINIPHTTWIQNMHKEKKNDYGNFFHFRAQKCI